MRRNRCPQAGVADGQNLSALLAANHQMVTADRNDSIHLSKKFVLTHVPVLDADPISKEQDVIEGPCKNFVVVAS